MYTWFSRSIGTGGTTKSTKKLVDFVFYDLIGLNKSHPLTKSKPLIIEIIRGFLFYSLLPLITVTLRTIIPNY